MTHPLLAELERRWLFLPPGRARKRLAGFIEGLRRCPEALAIFDTAVPDADCPHQPHPERPARHQPPLASGGHPSLPACYRLATL